MAKTPVVDKSVTKVERPTNLVVVEGQVQVGDVVEVVLRVNGVDVVSDYAPYTVEQAAAAVGGYVHVQAFLNVQERSTMAGMAPPKQLS